MELEFERVHLSRMIEQICSEFEPVLQEKNLTWKLDIEPEITMIGDPDKLSRVFDNLIRNACNYSYPDTEIQCSLKKENDSIVCRIKNHGKTISKEKMGRIFEQFFRVDSSRSSTTGGAGIILMLVLKLLASFVMTAFEKRYEELGFGESAEETGSFITKPEKLPQNQVNAKLKKMAEQLPKIKEIYDNREQYSEHLLSLVCNNPEVADFVKNYNDAEHIAKGGLTRKEKMQKIPLLLQWDKRWGYEDYGDNVLGLSGCAPTCLSMVVIGLTGNDAMTPDKIAEFATQNGYYVKGTGTSWSIMTEGAEKLGVQGTQISLSRNRIKGELEKGHPIICSVGPGDFTTEGHFIVLTGYENGEIKVNDPNCRTRSTLWDYEELQGQIRNLWAFQNS